jgi:hypothetical protein
MTPKPIHPVLALALALCLASCGDRAPEPTPPSAAPASGAFVRFTDVSASSGIIHQNVNGEPVEKMAIPENLGQGGAVLDYDGDGDLDVFLANGDVFEGQTPRSDPRCALYRNNGNWTYTDVTAEAGLVFKGWCHGATVVDFDADGHPDLYITCYLRENVFFRNRGDGTFEDVTATWGGGDPGPSTAAAFFDADGDGDLDLYVGNYVHYDPKKPPNNGNPCPWKGLLVSCGPRGTPPAADTFYENVDGKLVRATQKFGFDVEPAYTLGVITGDFDNDGDGDLYVAVDSEANYLFANHGGGRFIESASRYGLDMNEHGRPQAGMGVDFGDVDNDGRFDYYVTNFSHDYNTLYHNEKTKGGTTNFRDTTNLMRLEDPTFHLLSWGTRIVDLDLDGMQDLIAVSGHVYPQVDKANLDTSYAQFNQIFLNRGINAERGLVSFEPLPNTEAHGFHKKAVSRGLITFDPDDDGDMDLVIVEMDAPPTVLRNDGTGYGHWVGFQLVGHGKNRDAIGTRVTVTDAQGVVRYRERCSGQSYLSSVDPRLVFGLGGADGPVSVQIRWPLGSTQTLGPLEIDRYHRIEQAP